jgi:hypothetical protein
MKRIIPVLLAAMVGGCLSLTPADPAPWAKGNMKKDEVKKDDETKAADKKAEEKIAAKVPIVTTDGLNDGNAQQTADALDAEMKHDAENPPKVIVHARK